MGFWSNKEDEDKKPEVDEQEEQEEDEENTYEVSIECDNCGDCEDWEIPCGVLVEEHIKDEKCEMCECPLRRKR